VTQSEIGLERLRELLVSDYQKLTGINDFAQQYVPLTTASLQAAVEASTMGFRQSAWNTLMVRIWGQVNGPGVCSLGAQSPQPYWYNSTLGFTDSGGSLQPVIMNLELPLHAGDTIADVLAAPQTYQPPEVAGGETPAQFWVGVMGGSYQPQSGKTCPWLVSP
jgi:hypothetical protein